MGCCFSSKPKVVDPPSRKSPCVPPKTCPQVSSTPPPQNLQIPLPHDPQGSPLPDVPSRPPQDTPRTRPQVSSTPPLQNLQIPPPHDTQGSPLPDVPSRLPQDTPRTRPQDPPTPPPQDTPRQPLPDAPSSPTPPPEPVSEPTPPPPYSLLPLQDPQPSTLDSQTLSIQNSQTPTPILTTPPSDRSPPLTIPSTPSTITESSQPLTSSTTHPPVDVTELRSTSTSQTPDPTTNSSTLVISLPQAPGNLARDQREQRVVQALKATLHRMRTTLRKAPSSVPRVQNFVKMNLDVVDLIEMSSEEHELQDFYDLMHEINAQFVALIDHFSIPEDLQRKIDSVASRINEFVPGLSKLLEGRSLEHTSIAGDGSLPPVVAQFLRRIKEELDSRTNDSVNRAASTSASRSVPEVRVTLQQVEGGVSVKIDMLPRPREDPSPVTIVPAVTRPPSPSPHEDLKRASLPRCPPISPIEISSFQNWNGESSARGQDPQIA